MKLKQLATITFLITTMCLGLISCGGKGPTLTPTPTPSNGAVNIGALTNGSIVYASSANPQTTQNGTTSIAIGITEGLTPYTGTLSFRITAANGAINTKLQGSTALPTIATNPTPCILNSVANSTCSIIISGNNANPGTYLATPILTATTGNQALNNIVITVTAANNNHVTPGHLAVALAKSGIYVESTTIATIILDNSSNIANLPVKITPSNPNVATISKNICTLSTTNNTCQVTITGISPGTSSITANAGGIYQPASANITINHIPGNIILNLATNKITVGNKTTATVILNNAIDVNNLAVNITSSNSDIAAVAPSSCVIASSIPPNNSCSVNINGNRVGGPVTITATSSGYIKSTDSLQVVSPPESLQVVFGQQNGDIFLNNTALAFGQTFSAPITAITYDNNNNVYVGTADGNVWISSIAVESQVNWSSFSNSTFSANSYAANMEFDNALSQLIVITSDTSTYIAGYGNSWTQIDGLLPGATSLTLASYNNNGSSAIYTGTTGGIYTLTTHPISWESIPAEQNQTITAITVVNPDLMYAAKSIFDTTTTYVVQIESNSNTTTISSKVPGTFPSVNSIVISNGNAYITSQDQVYYSPIHNSQSWQTYGSFSGATEPLSNLTQDSQQSFYVLNGNNIYKKLFTENQWTLLKNGEVGGQTLAMDKNNHRLYSGQHALFSLDTSKSGQWVQLGNGFPNQAGLSALAYDNTSGNIYAATETQANGNVYVYHSFNNSTILANNALPSGVTQFALNNLHTRAYAATNSGFVYLTDTNSTESWLQNTTPVPYNLPPSALTIDKADNVYVGIYGALVYKNNSSVNESWALVGNSAIPNGSSVNAIAADKHTIYAAITGTSNNGYVYKTNSSGEWQELATALPDNGSATALSLNDGGDVFVGSSNGNIYTFNNNSWKNVAATALPNNGDGGVSAIAIYGQTIYVGSGNGNVYTLNTQQWSKFNNINGSSAITGIQLFESQ